LKGLGVKLRLEYEGLRVQSVKDGSGAHEVGVREGDLLTHVDGMPTRYLPLRKADEIVHHSDKEKVVLTVRRPALLTRK
jgi:carboxyl-terminal processing protease